MVVRLRRFPQGHLPRSVRRLPMRRVRRGAGVVRRALAATTLATLALAAPALATYDDPGIVGEIQTNTERMGWPHEPSKPELRALASAVTDRIVEYINT